MFIGGTFLGLHDFSKRCPFPLERRTSPKTMSRRSRLARLVAPLVSFGAASALPWLRILCGPRA